MTTPVATRPRSGRSGDAEARALLCVLQDLREAVHEEATEQLDAWRPRIERRSFLLSARNLAACASCSSP
jgi:hypothetical protein